SLRRSLFCSRSRTRKTLTWSTALWRARPGLLPLGSDRLRGAPILRGGRREGIAVLHRGAQREGGAQPNNNALSERGLPSQMRPGGSYPRARCFAHSAASTWTPSPVARCVCGRLLFIAPFCITAQLPVAACRAVPHDTRAAAMGFFNRR